jgi:polysaccharide export outer membrane protein
MLRRFFWQSLVWLVAITFLIGCANSSSSAPTMGVEAPLTNTARAPKPSNAPQATGVDYFAGSADLQSLSDLWTERTTAKLFSDYPIGPGDTIVITVPAMKEMSDLTYRVSTIGDIDVPMIGQVHAAGLTQAALKSEISKRLGKYLYNPDAQVFVKEYRSREVAVVGSVKAPGIFSLVGPSETILELISQAGGTTDGAADNVVLLPATPGQTAPSPEVLAMVTSEAHHGTPSEGSVKEISLQATSSPTPFVGKNGRPVIIALRSNLLTGSERYLNMPVRPGDILVVPSGGEVAVIGWVYNPGHFKVSSGLSAMSAIGAAGGPLYAADQTDVHLFRLAKNGATESMNLNLESIKRGEQPDPPVQGNDVIEVSYSNARIVPYIFYNILLNKVTAPVPTY